MVQRRQRERSLFEVLLPDGHKLWPDWLRKIDTLLEDEAVIEVVAQSLEARWPQSRRRGRPGTPAEVVLRMLILKHLFDWSYDDLEREVRANLVYRMFTRIDAGDVPDAKTILKIARWVRRSSTSFTDRWSRSQGVPGSRTVADFASTPRS
jgi:transposase, IS5 family